MRNFYQSLMRIDEGQGIPVARIIHYGDSHVAVDILTGALRQQFQRDFGDAGLGFILPVKPWTWYSRKGLVSDSSPGWKFNGLSQSSVAKDQQVGLAGMGFTTYGSGERFRLETRCSKIEIHLMKQPGGGAVEILLDGLLYHRASLASDSISPVYLEIKTDDDEKHTLELRTVSNGPVRVFGVVAEREGPGMTYDALGLNGARASGPLLWDWKIFADNLERRDPDLIIIAYGSNEAGDSDFDPSRYTEEFSTLLAYFRRAVPNASLLVISPPDRAVRSGSKWQTLNRMPALVRAQRRAALGAGAAFWNLFEAMGGEGSIERWATRAVRLAQSDRVHLTSAGYRLVAEALYKELMRGYVWALLGDGEAQGREGAAAAVPFWFGSAGPVGTIAAPSRLSALPFDIE